MPGYPSKPRRRRIARRKALNRGFISAMNATFGGSKEIRRSAARLTRARKLWRF